MTGIDFVESLRNYLTKDDGSPVPWLEAGRSRELGVDCTGLIVCALQDIGVPIKDTRKCTKFDEFMILMKAIRSQCESVEKNFAPATGTIILFRGDTIHNHVAVYCGDGKIIHSYNDPSYNRVLEQDYTAYWKLNTHSMYWFKGLEK